MLQTITSIPTVISERRKDPNRTIIAGDPRYLEERTMLFSKCPNSALTETILTSTGTGIANEGIIVQTVIGKSAVPETIISIPKEIQAISTAETITICQKNYKLEKKLTGGVAEVWIALDSETGENVIIKKVSKIDKLIHKSAYTEIIAYRKLMNAKYTGKLITFEDKEDAVVLVIKYEKGDTLGIIASRYQTFQQKMDAFKKILEAVQEIHYYGLLHLDLKPGNIMVLPDGSMRVIDFGISREYIISFDDEKVAVVERQPYMMGTLGYAAHEQFGLNDFIGVKADIHAVCALGYFIFANQNPYFKDYKERVTVKSLVGKMFNSERLFLGSDIVPDWLASLLYAGISEKAHSRPSLETIKAEIEFNSQSSG